MAVVVAVPLGIGTAVYMTEVRGPGSHLIRTVVEAMTALSDILAGLFVYALLVVGFGLRQDRVGRCDRHRGHHAAARRPGGRGGAPGRPGGLARGERGARGHPLEDEWKVVLPSARAGLATAGILAIARASARPPSSWSRLGCVELLQRQPVSEPMNSLPLFIYTAYRPTSRWR